MIIKWLKKIFINRNERYLLKIKKIVEVINSIEPKYKALSDQQLQEKTKEFKYLLQNKKKKVETLIPEIYATVREASSRVLGMRHFDVQLMGGIALNDSCIAEMKTGEGKTLTSTLPIYLNALQGKGVHVVTMNDYLATRDAKKNQSLFNFLGLTVGINLSGMNNNLKRLAYQADITYGTNHEYGFDYLRDNMVFSKYDQVQRQLFYAIIDEVDSILIDESRTPLIISGPIEEDSRIYFKINKIISYLIKQDKEDSDDFLGKGDYIVDEKFRQIYLTDRGLIKIEQLLIKFNLIKKIKLLYTAEKIILIQHVIAALKANELFTKDVDYIIKNKTVVIVDEHTGRIMQGRRWSDGIHQAIEVKEKVPINYENQTLASITFQNYFRLYKKLSGMTGTAETESFEFKSIYGLETIVIPTNRPMIRRDFPDLVYATQKEKINAVINDIKKCVKKYQPVLVGTISIEKSELISKKLKKLKIKHNVLNAKSHEKEAQIISEAGKPGSVTIATNMAGRGTDIVLGGSILDFLNYKKKKKKFKNNKNCQYANLKRQWIKDNQKVLSLGGLHIIGTERHESRRIDNQLRGRSGRQGDCGSSRFYLSMEDSLMRIFSTSKVINIMKKLGMKEGEAIEHPWVAKAIKNAQKKVENRNFNYRQQLLEYDDIINEQRKAIYGQRQKLITISDIQQFIITIMRDVLTEVIGSYLKNNLVKDNNVLVTKLFFHLKNDFCIDYQDLKNIKKVNQDDFVKNLINNCIKYYQEFKKSKFHLDDYIKYEKLVVLTILDLFWKDHLSAMDELKQGISLRAYAQKNPKQEYKRESLILFASMIYEFKYELVAFLFRNKNLDINLYKINKSDFFTFVYEKRFLNFYLSLK